MQLHTRSNTTKKIDMNAEEVQELIIEALQRKFKCLNLRGDADVEFQITTLPLLRGCTVTWHDSIQHPTDELELRDEQKS